MKNLLIVVVTVIVTAFVVTSFGRVGSAMPIGYGRSYYGGGHSNYNSWGGHH